MDRPKAPRIGLGMAKIGLGMAAVGALICWTAGNWAWGWAWAFTVITALSLTALALGLLRINPQLFAERQESPFAGAAQPDWDRRAVIGLFVTMAAWVLIPGLEARWLSGWAMPLILRIAGGALLPVALRIMYQALAHNRALLPAVEVRAGTRLADTGPYARVRHPYYAGFILFYAAGSLMLTSWLALAWTLVIGLVFAWRLTREEAVLMDALSGYDAYRRSVRYRLVPGIW